MDKPKLSFPEGLLSTVYGVVIILLGAFLRIVPLALGVMVAAELYRGARHNTLTKEGLIHTSPIWLAGLSGVLFIGLQTRPATQLVLAVAYGVWRWQLIHSQRQQGHSLAVAGVTELLALMAIYLAGAVWHWPALIIVALAWGSSFVIASRVVEGLEERAASVLIAAWCLIVAECSWLFSLWLVTYILFNGVLLIPQAAVVITALGYCLSGIYFSHRRSQLSRTRLIEYLLVGLVLLVVVIAGTKWSGVI